MPESDAVLDKAETRESTKVAALDIGSNSFHLVVARVFADSVQIIHRVKQRVRLAEGLNDNNELSEDAIQRGLRALDEIAESLSGLTPDSVRIVATYTLRKATNAKTFLKAAKTVLPYPIEIISGTEEARLIYSGVAHTRHDSGQRLVIDIGGGSTEFIIGEGLEPKLLRSLQMGCVSYTKRFFAQGTLTKKAFDKAITAAQQELELIDDKFNRLGWQICVGTSGTINAVCSLVHELNGNDGSTAVSGQDLTLLIEHCCDAGHSDRLTFSALSDSRRPVFAAGLAILTAAFKSLAISTLEYSAAALREGVIYQMEEQLTQPDIRQRTAQSLASRYDVDIEHAKRVFNTTITLYEQVAGNWQIAVPEFRSMLGWAALLHEVGLQINSRRIQHHSAYIIEHVDMPGFNQEQQNLVATLVRFHRKKIRAEEIPEFTEYSDLTVKKLISLLRLGVLFSIKRQDDMAPFKANAKKDRLMLSFNNKWLPERPIFLADLESEAQQMEALDVILHFK